MKNDINSRADSFLKSCIIGGGKVRFEHRGSEYYLTSKCFEKLEGCTVLINSALEVFRSDAKIGTAVHAA